MHALLCLLKTTELVARSKVNVGSGDDNVVALESRVSKWDNDGIESVGESLC